MFEKRVHLLERTTCGLWIEEDHEGNTEDVEAEEEEQSAVADCLEEERRDERYYGVADGPSNDGPGTPFGSDVEWKNLGRIQLLLLVCFICSKI